MLLIAIATLFITILVYYLGRIHGEQKECKLWLKADGIPQKRHNPHLILYYARRYELAYRIRNNGRNKRRLARILRQEIRRYFGDSGK